MEPLILFDKKHIRLILLLCAFFVIAVSFKLHGYSFSLWRDYIDGSAKKDILLGKDRVIRSDDWVVEIPMMLAQLTHDPKYPLINKNIGTGLNMIPHSKVAINHILTLFRPSVWGFFIGADHGLSWMWQFMTLGLFYMFFLVFMIISRNDFHLSVSAGLFLIFSPFFQFWSFHKAEIPIFMGLAFISFCYLCFSPNKKTIMIHGLVFGWALSCFTLNFVYPPFQVSCAYLLIFMMIGIIADRCKDCNMRFFASYRISAIVVSLCILAFAGMTYYVIAKDIIKVMMNTVYPGQRFMTGGDLTPGIFFRNIFFTPLYIAHIDMKWTIKLTNICEAASFLYLFPITVSAILYRTFRLGQITDRFSVIMAGYVFLMLFYSFIGFYPSVSRYSLFYLMPSYRAIIGLGIGDVILIVSFLSNIRDTDRSLRKLISISYGISLFIFGSELRNHSEQISFPFIIAVSFFMILLSYYITDVDKRRISISLLAVISFASTFWFNPIVSGGSSFIYHNELSEKILEIHNKENKNTVWAAFGRRVTPNLFRMLGVRCINGTHSYPMFDLWEKFDPQNRYFSEYNRYAQVSFTPSLTDSIQFRSATDLLFVYIDPSSDVLDQMGVTHVLVHGEAVSFFDTNKKFEKLYAFQDKAIYKVNEK